MSPTSSPSVPSFVNSRFQNPVGEEYADLSVPADGNGVDGREDRILKLAANEYFIKFFFQLSKCLQVEAQSFNQPVLSHVISHIKGDSPLYSPLPRPLYHDQVNSQLRSFTELFNQATSFTQLFRGETEGLSEGEETGINFKIKCAADFLKNNVLLKNMLEKAAFDEIRAKYSSFRGEVEERDFHGITLGRKHLKKIIDTNTLPPDVEAALGPEVSEKIKGVFQLLDCRREDEMIRLRLTKSTFLDPSLLSRMSDGKLTAEEARLLISCASLKDKSKVISVCDLKSGTYSDGLPELLRKKKRPTLIFKAPSSSSQELSPTIDWSEASENIDIISRGSQLITDKVLEILKPIFHFLDESSSTYVRDEIEKGAQNHIYLRETISLDSSLYLFLKMRFDECFHEAIKEIFENVKGVISPGLATLDLYLKKMPSDKQVDDECSIAEKRALIMDIEEANKEGEIEEKFNAFKHLLWPFLLFSTETFALGKAYSYEIKWELDGIEIKQTMSLEKSCAVGTRVEFESLEGASRVDLTYFPAESNPDSILKRWNDICIENHFTDLTLAEKLLTLYEKGTVECSDEVKRFLAPLTVLLMAKETFFDRASLAANFILLKGVKLGVLSFEEALRAMPMIPQGAISSKQFLLHITGAPLDAISGVKYKRDQKAVPPSSFLSTTATFLGAADEWRNKYEEVATIAVKICQRVFIPHQPEKAEIMTLKRNLEMLHGELSLYEIPRILDGLLTRLKTLGDNCLKFCRSKLPSEQPKELDPLNAIHLCRKWLRSEETDHETVGSIIAIIKETFPDYPYDTNLTREALADLIDTREVIEQIRYQAVIARAFFLSIGVEYELRDSIRALIQYLTSGIDRNNEKIRGLKDILDRVYGESIPFTHLAEAIEYRGNEDGKDEVGKWAIDYLLEDHPLKKIS